MAGNLFKLYRCGRRNSPLGGEFFITRGLTTNETIDSFMKE